jgi:hypothetical protein
LNRWRQFFDKMIWVAVGLAGVTGYEAYSNWNHSQTWKYSVATIESVRTVCRFHKKEIWQRRGRSADEYCDDRTAVAERKRAGWNQNRQSLVEIQVVYPDEKNRKSYAKLLPWESHVGLLTVGQKIDIQYSDSSPQDVDFAGAPAKQVGEALEGFAFSLLLGVAMCIGWMWARRRDTSPST